MTNPDRDAICKQPENRHQITRKWRREITKDMYKYMTVSDKKQR